MLKFFKLTFIGLLVSTLAFAQNTDRSIMKYPKKSKAPKSEKILFGANEFQKSFKEKTENKNTKATTVFLEEFSSGSIPSSFTLYDQDGLTPATNVSYVNAAWVANPNILDSSDYTALSTSWYDPPGTADDWMITPKISIPIGAQMSWDAITYDATYPDGYEVLISTTDSSISSFTTTLFSVAAENSSWTNRTVSLNAFSGQTVFIAFRNNSNDKFLLAIDDIHVYQPDPYELAVNNITEPNNNSCTQTNAENVTIEIENAGSDSITGGFDVYYAINGNTPVTETITDTLIPGDTMMYTFNTTADLSAYQTYDIKAYTAFPQDNNQNNDTAYSSVVSADGVVSVELTTDGYPSEISWELVDQNNQIIATSPVYDTKDTTITTNVCIISSNCYTFTIYDTFGDGIMSPGGYAIYMDSVLVDSSYSFNGSQESVYHIGNGCPANDLSVEILYALGKFPKDGGSPQSFKAVVKNWGTDNQTNTEVYLDITGANTYQDTVSISSINSLDSDTVMFSGFNPSSLGTGNINVAVATDEDNSNNAQNYRQEVTTATFNHADTSAMSQGIGFNTGEGFMLARYHVHGTKSIEAARVNVSGSAAGNQIFGVLVDANGNILSTGSPVSINAADTNTYVELPLNPFNINDQDIYIGFAQMANPSNGYFPLNTQIEEPGRTDAFYYVSGLNGGALTNSADLGRWMLEGVISDPISDDAILTKITDIKSGCNLSSKAVEIGIYNNGTDTIFNIDVAYTVNGGTPVTESLTDTIGPLDTLMYTFPTPVDASAFNSYDIKAYVDLADDTIHENDSAMIRFYNIEPTDVPYTTGFENFDDNYAWTFIDANNDGVMASVIPNANAHSGANIVEVPGGSGKQNEYVISRCMNLDSGKTYQVSFWHHAGSFFGTPIPENVELVMGTSPEPASLTTLIEDLGTVDEVSFTKSAHTFSVGTSDVYYIAFHITTDMSFFYRIDDFTVSDVTSLEETAESMMSIYPNPAKNIVTVDGGELNIDQVQIYNTMGQMITSKEANSSKLQLNVSDYKAGMYFIRMMTNQGLVVKKFQVNN